MNSTHTKAIENTTKHCAMTVGITDSLMVKSIEDNEPWFTKTTCIAA